MGRLHRARAWLVEGVDADGARRRRRFVTERLGRMWGEDEVIRGRFTVATMHDPEGRALYDISLVDGEVWRTPI